MIYSVWVVVDLMFIHLKLLFLRDLLKRSANCVGTSISVDAEVAVTIKRSLYDTIRYFNFSNILWYPEHGFGASQVKSSQCC